MKKILFALAFGACLMAVSCEKIESRSSEYRYMGGSFIALTKAQQEMTAGINDFAFNLYRELYNTDEQLFVSPFSISLALAMTTTGAAGQTESELRSALGFGDASVDEMNGYYGLLSQKLCSLDPKVTLEIANAIWARTPLAVKDKFKSDCKKYFNSEFTSANFDKSTLDAINKWCSDHTHGKISTILTELPDTTVMVLVNALYFYSEWAFKFSNAGKHAFNGFGSTDKLGMMKTDIITPYYSNDLFSCVELPYGGGVFVMDVILPEKSGEAAFEDLVETLTAEKWAELTQGGSIAEVDVTMPEFSLSYNRELSEDLKKLGIRRAFTPDAAEFPGMFEGSDIKLCISQVIHKTFIDVNKKGTEAVAVTAVTMDTASAGPSAPPIPVTIPKVTFNADRPFLFIIRERSSGVIVFIGQKTSAA